MLTPKILTTLKNYSLSQFYADLIAGVIVGIVALPLAIAFAIASGVSPEKGLYTAIIGGFLISLLGGSRVQIGGPTGAFVVVVSAIVLKYGVDGLTLATIMAGVILAIMGIARVGSMIKFIPHPVVVGFTSGIALIIFSTQVKDFLGLNVAHTPSHFLQQWIVYFQQLPHLQFETLAIAALALLLTLLGPKISKVIPGSLLAIVVTTLLVQFFGLPVETIGDRFGNLSMSFPTPHLPPISFELIRNLMGPAMVIALLGGIEALLSAVVADGMIGGRHRSNMELLGQGIANIITPLFGGIPATGAIARTATNIKSGGRSPVAGIVHALMLLLILLFLGKLAVLIPMSALAAILMVVAYNMSEWRSFTSLLKGPRSDIAVLLSTFLITLFFDLSLAIAVGLVMSSFLFMQRMAEISNISEVTSELNDDLQKEVLMDKLPEGVQLYEINGPFFFGAAQKYKEAMITLGNAPKVLILRLRHVPFMDASGVHVIEEVHHHCLKNNTLFLITDLHTQPLHILKTSGLIEKISRKNVFHTLKKALEHLKAQ